MWVGYMWCLYSCTHMHTYMCMHTYFHMHITGTINLRLFPLSRFSSATWACVRYVHFCVYTFIYIYIFAVYFCFLCMYMVFGHCSPTTTAGWILRGIFRKKLCSPVFQYICHKVSSGLCLNEGQCSEQEQRAKQSGTFVWLVVIPVTDDRCTGQTGQNLVTFGSSFCQLWSTAAHNTRHTIHTKRSSHAFKSNFVHANSQICTDTCTSTHTHAHTYTHTQRQPGSWLPKNPDTSIFEAYVTLPHAKCCVYVHNSYSLIYIRALRHAHSFALLQRCTYVRMYLCIRMPPCVCVCLS
jgi:hypothetical protein